MPALPAVTSGRRRKRWLRRALLLVLAGVVALLAAELAVRVRVPEPVAHLVPDPVLNHVWRAGASRLHAEFAAVGVAPYVHAYNAQGWVELHDVERRPPPGTLRIVYLGDSFTEGTCPMDRSVPSLVEAALAPRLAEHGAALQVINTGTSSHSPILHAIRLRTQLLDYGPDLLVVNVDMTDVFDDYLYAQTARRDEQGHLVAAPPGIPLEATHARTPFGLARKTPRYRFNRWMRTHSRLFALLRPTIRLEGTRAGDRLVSDDGLPSLYDWCEEDPWSERTAALVAVSMGALTELVQLADGHGLPVVVTAIPHLEHFDGRFGTRPFDVVEQTARAAGALYLDSWRGLRERIGEADPADFYIPGDMHFNERGYAAWADVQADFLAEHALPLLLGGDG